MFTTWEKWNSDCPNCLFYSLPFFLQRGCSDNWFSRLRAALSYRSLRILNRLAEMIRPELLMVAICKFAKRKRPYNSNSFDDRRTERPTNLNKKNYVLDGLSSPVKLLIFDSNYFIFEVTTETYTYTDSLILGLCLESNCSWSPKLSPISNFFLFVSEETFSSTKNQEGWRDRSLWETFNTLSSKPVNSDECI